VILLDASALLAWLHEEPGAEVVAEALDTEDGVIPVVNLAEVLEHALRIGADPSRRLAELGQLVSFEPVMEADALTAAQLYPVTRQPALSLADRIALATAQRLAVPILTAERAWNAVPGADVVLIR
jgi:PIN domain nuclease of toxin-antitoxin system